jgi:hypothetical protein
MIDQPTTPPLPDDRGVPILSFLFLIIAVFACSIYANLSFAVTNKTDYQYFPPFKPNVNANLNDHLGGEYFNMARALAAGEGFAHPFDGPTGPTAWQPPVLPLFLAGLLWASGGDLETVTVVVVFLQVFVLIGTGFLILALIQRTTTRISAGVAATVFLVGLLANFWLCFQYTHDGWLVLLTVDLLVAGFCWCRPLDRWKTAAAWGLFGGLCAMINPGVALAWGLLSLLVGIRNRAWLRLALAVLVAGLTLTPWTIRNYLVFGRFIPIKSNLFYEMYQSQGLQTVGNHPYHANGRERREYNRLGETAFLDRKREQLFQAIEADPLDFAGRVANRFLSATVWYVQFPSGERGSRPLIFWISRLTHPLPFLALLVLVFSAFWQRLHAAQWTVISIYCLYLLPYVGASYYERYGLPLMGVKILLILWAIDRLMPFWPWGRAAVELRSEWSGKRGRESI